MGFKVHLRRTVRGFGGTVPRNSNPKGIVSFRLCSAAHPLFRERHMIQFLFGYTFDIAKPNWLRTRAKYASPPDPTRSENRGPIPWQTIAGTREFEAALPIAE
jgi:hypothetical protein